MGAFTKAILTMSEDAGEMGVALHWTTLEVEQDQDYVTYRDLWTDVPTYSNITLRVGGTK